MATNITTSDIYRVITGDPVEIDFPYPLKEPAGVQWRMAQPSDWLYDMAMAVGEAAEAELMQQPEMERCKNLPPSPAWLERQERSIRDTEERIAALEAKGDALLPEEAIDLEVQRDLLSRLIKPENYTRAQELGQPVRTNARNNYLIQRLVVDGEGKPLFDPGTAEGRARWERLGRKNRNRLLSPLMQAMMLVQIAKNSSAGPNSA